MQRSLTTLKILNSELKRKHYFHKQSFAIFGVIFNWFKRKVETISSLGSTQELFFTDSLLFYLNSGPILYCDSYLELSCWNYKT